jgi:2-phosphosulfolactate phosphatase
VRCHVALTPAEAIAAPFGIVVDVMRATSTIAQALASGYRRVLCCAEIDDARMLKTDLGDAAITGGERSAQRITGFDAGASPREFLEPQAETLILSTTNGTRAIVTAAASCEHVVVGSLLNLDAVVAAVRTAGVSEVAILCAGVEGAFALDDAYVAGRIVAALGGELDDAAVAATRLARAFATAEEGIAGGVSAANIRNAELDADIAFCARESVLDLVPRVVERTETSVVIRPTYRP